MGMGSGVAKSGERSHGTVSVSGAFGRHLTKCLANTLEMVAERARPKGARVKVVHLGVGKYAADINQPRDYSLPHPRATEQRERDPKT